MLWCHDQQDTHSGNYSGHFSGRRLYNTLSSSWWWDGMYADAERFAKSCPQCVVAMGTGRKNKPPLHPIPVQRPFQILGIDVMDLPLTERGNRHVVVIQDLFTKWPLVFPVPDQKAARIAKLIAEEVDTTAHHPQCDGAVERFNRTLKTVLAARFGNQWDLYLSGVLWTYQNTPHTSTGHSFYSSDCLTDRSHIYASVRYLPCATR